MKISKGKPTAGARPAGDAGVPAEVENPPRPSMKSDEPVYDKAGIDTAGKSTAPQEKPSPSYRGERSRFPNGADMLAMIGAIIVSAFFGGIVYAVMQSAGAESGLILAVSYLCQFLPAIIFISYFRRKRGAAGPGARLAPRKMNPPLILWGILLITVMSVVLEPVIALFPDKYLDGLYESMGRGGWTVLTTAVLAPVLEETLFRGQILGSLRNRYGALRALLLSSLLFGIIHLNPPQMLNAFFMGLVLGYIYIRTGSLLSVIVIHAFNNAVAYIQMEAFDAQASAGVRTMINNDAVYYVVYGICLALVVVGIIGMWRTVRKQKKYGDAEKMAVPVNNTATEK